MWLNTIVVIYLAPSLFLYFVQVSLYLAFRWKQNKITRSKVSFPVSFCKYYQIIFRVLQLHDTTSRDLLHSLQALSTFMLKLSLTFVNLIMKQSWSFLCQSG